MNDLDLLERKLEEDYFKRSHDDDIANYRALIGVIKELTAAMMEAIDNDQGDHPYILADALESTDAKIKEMLK